MGKIEQDTPRLRFQAKGGVRQAVLKRATQLPALVTLDPKNWMALSCPAGGHEMDDSTLAAIDMDKDGRLRVREIRQTIKWLGKVLKDLSPLEMGSDALALEELREDTVEGRLVRASAEHLLGLVGSSDSTLDLEQLEAGCALMEDIPMNGDGIIDARATGDPEVRELIKDVTQTIGAVESGQGTAGVTADSLEQFVAACSAFSEWHKTGHATNKHAQLFILGEDTEPAMEALARVEEKISEWFELCRTYAYAQDLVKPVVEAQALETRPLSDLRKFPSLPLSGGFNPAWADRIGDWLTKVVEPVLGTIPPELSHADWNGILERFSAYRAWRMDQPGSSVSSLGIDRVNKWLDQTAVREKLQALILEDLDLKDEIEGIREVKRLLLLKRDFWEFIRNFVNFDHFYSLERQAIFQVGVLYLDGRSFRLCVPVKDQKAHTALAVKSGLHLVYCQLTRPGQATSPLIAAAVTNGDSRRLIMGKQGVFYDRDDLEWDARIIQIIEQPINLRQAVTEPFRRIGSLLVSHMEKLSSSREKSLQKDVIQEMTETEGKIASATAGESAALADSRQSGGVGGFVAGGGVAIAAVTSSLALLSSTLSRINPVYFLFAFLSIVALILLPTMMVAWLRLRGRDIGLLLEAGGWAINAPMRLTGKLGRQLTQVASRR